MSFALLAGTRRLADRSSLCWNLDNSRSFEMVAEAAMLLAAYSSLLMV